MPPAVVAVGAAAVGAGAGIWGASKSAKAQKQAAEKSSDTALEVAGMNNALQEKIYNQNLGVLGPYAALGLPAGTAINSLLGVATSPATGALAQYGNGPALAAAAGPAPAPAPAAPALINGVDPGWAQTAMQAMLGDLSGAGNEDRGYKVAYRNFATANPIKYAADGKLDPAWAAGAYAAVKPALEQNLSQQPDRDISRTYRSLLASRPAPPVPTSTPMAPAPAAPAPAAPVAPPAAAPPAGTVTAALAGPAPSMQDAAFKNYLNSTGYKFQVEQGQEAINQGYAARGALQSGAAMKALQTYGQNTATSFFKDYLGLLANQQAVGLTGAGAVAGVGTGYANSVGANNSLAAQQQIAGYGQVANAQQGLYGAIAGGIGGIAGAAGNAFGSSYKPPY